MSSVKIELNHDGIRELLRSQEMREACEDLAKSAAQRCGAGYESDSYTGPGRVNAMVYADTAAARKDNSDNNTILRCLK